MPKTKRVIVAPSGIGRIPLDKLKTVVKSMHILPDKQGGWAVRGDGRIRVEANFSSKQEAVEYARRISVERQKDVIFVHGRDGKVREMNTFGRDSFSPRKRTPAK